MRRASRWSKLKLNYCERRLVSKHIDSKRYQPNSLDSRVQETKAEFLFLDVLGVHDPDLLPPAASPFSASSCLDIVTFSVLFYD
jgi:hypothetical protein